MRAAARGERTLFWGGVDFPASKLSANYLAVGTVGSGKTLLVLCLLRSALVGPEPGFRLLGKPAQRLLHRALVYDAKGDLYQKLCGLGVPEEDIWLLNPLDVRSRWWDVAADFEGRVAARQLANTLVSASERLTQPFFPKEARNLLTEVVHALQQSAPGNWGLGDVVRVASYEENLRAILQRTEQGRALLEAAVRNRSFPEVYATLRSELLELEPAALLWERMRDAGQPGVSINEWVRGEHPRVLLLSTDDEFSKAIDPLNRLLIDRASVMARSRLDEYPQDETWFFLDELRLIGRLEELTPLVLKGRSKGVHVVIAFQDLMGLFDVYGRERAMELTAVCNNMALLRVDCRETRRWITEFVGKEEIYRETQSFTYSRDNSRQVSGRYEVTPKMLDSELAQFPLASVQRGVAGLMATPEVGMWLGGATPGQLKRSVPGRARGAAPKRIPTPQQGLAPWSGPRPRSSARRIPPAG